MVLSGAGLSTESGSPATAARRAGRRDVTPMTYQAFLGDPLPGATGRAAISGGGRTPAPMWVTVPSRRSNGTGSSGPYVSRRSGSADLHQRAFGGSCSPPRPRTQRRVRPIRRDLGWRDANPAAGPPPGKGHKPCVPTGEPLSSRTMSSQRSGSCGTSRGYGVDRERRGKGALIGMCGLPYDERRAAMARFSVGGRACRVVCVRGCPCSSTTRRRRPRRGPAAARAP